MENIVLSMTSYLPRFPTLHLCLSSLFSQSVPANQINLYLDNDVSPGQLSEQIISYQEQGLQIIYTPHCLKCHTKYYYAMQDYPNSIIITVDDDVIYEPDFIEKLLNSFRKYPNAISAGRVHKITVNTNGQVDPYQKWIHECTSIHVPSKELFATGVGGILYPPGCLGSETFNKQILSRLSLYADDIWLKVMELRYDIPIVYTEQRRIHPKTIPGSQDSALFLHNKNMGRNDRYLQLLLDYYGMDFAALLSK